MLNSLPLVGHFVSINFLQIILLRTQIFNCVQPFVCPEIFSETVSHSWNKFQIHSSNYIYFCQTKFQTDFNEIWYINRSCTITVTAIRTVDSLSVISKITENFEIITVSCIRNTGLVERPNQCQAQRIDQRTENISCNLGE